MTLAKRDSSFYAPSPDANKNNDANKDNIEAILYSFVSEQESALRSLIANQKAAIPVREEYKKKYQNTRENIRGKAKSLCGNEEMGEAIGYLAIARFFLHQKSDEQIRNIYINSQDLFKEKLNRCLAAQA